VGGIQGVGRLLGKKSKVMIIYTTPFSRVRLLLFLGELALMIQGPLL